MSLASKVRRQYFNQKLSGSYSGLSGFLRNRKFKDAKAVQEELLRLRAFSLHKPIRKKFQTRAVLVHFANFQLVTDLIDYQKYARYYSLSNHFYKLDE